jgi:hypothetical protein
VRFHPRSSSPRSTARPDHARPRTIGEDDLLAGLFELLRLEVELAAHGVLGLEHVLVEQGRVQHLAVLDVDGGVAVIGI